jgi:hypothetical protein
VGILERKCFATTDLHTDSEFGLKAIFQNSVGAIYAIGPRLVCYEL